MSKTLTITTIIILIVLSACSSRPNQPVSAYHQQILQERHAKDSSFIFDMDSPIPDSLRKTFEGLSYFPVDEDFIMNARFTLNPDPVPFEMATTTDRRPVYVMFGTAEFELEGKWHKLEIYRNLELSSREGYEDHLFIPFRDQTSGKESYGGGRYIDAKIPVDSMLVLDFNQAYNPYCAYNERYSCPIPPVANTLKVAIMAGEMKPSFGH